MKDRARQSNRDAKKRKAKSRAKAAMQQRGRSNRRKSKPPSYPSPFFGAAASLALGKVIREQPDFLDYYLGDAR